MSDTQSPPPIGSKTPAPKPDQKVFKVGNLIYTRKGLVALFAWLLWFDFSWNLMESVLGPILQFHLLNKDGLNCDPWLYKTLIGTAPAILQIFWTPFLSIKSDRHRGPRGRRVPFLLYAAPPVCLCLAVLAFGNEIGAWIQSTFLQGASLATVTIWVFGILAFLYTVFNTYLGTAFYYLFNDVVPEEHFVKFMAWMRAFGAIAGVAYMHYIYGASAKSGPLEIDLAISWPFAYRFYWHIADYIWYPKIILLGAAFFYLLAGTVPMLMIKEPQYPPPPPLAESERFLPRIIQSLRTLAKECFSHKFYIIFFLIQIMAFMSYQMSDFMNPARQEMGMDLQSLGDLNAMIGLVSIPLIFITGAFGDRFHPVPLMLVAVLLQVTTCPIQLLFLIPGLSPDTYYYIQMATNLIFVPVGLVTGLAEGPFGMTVLPRERYGQFCGVAAMLRNVLAMVIGSQLAGLVMSAWKAQLGEYAYRLSWAWTLGFTFLLLIGYYLLYREWKKLGGRHGFVPPPVGPGAASAT